MVNQVIPFRENKLTHLFMPIFTGRSASSISMIVNVNPAAPDFDETNHVLSYASKAKMVQIEENPIIAMDPQQKTEEYGYNGRPIKKTKSAASKIASLVKKLSPKKLMSRSNNNAAAEKKRADQTNADRKRKAAPPLVRVPSFSATSTTSYGSQNSMPKTKRMRVVKPSSTQNTMHRSNSASSLTNAENEVKSLKIALSIAQAEIEILKSEKVSLSDELAQVETNIRQEVSEEMEEQLVNAKLHYTNIIDQMKAQARQSVGVFEKRAREERAAAQIDLLLFKVEECEEEMKRQEDSHREEISALKKQHNEALAAHQRQIQSHKEQLKKSNPVAAGGQAEVVETQRLKIQEQEKELEALKKSKTDLIASYESLLADGAEDDNDDDGDDAEEEEEDDDESTESNNDENDSSRAPQYSSNKQSAPKYNMVTRNRAVKRSNTHDRRNRAPLSSISENAH